MDKIYLRADDFDLSNILSYFIERDIDKKNIAILSNDQPVLLVGSRGTGKTMLMRVTAKKLHKAFKKNRVLPVYLSLSSCAIISNQNFRRWVLHKILLYLDTALREEGFFDLFKDLRSPKIVCKASVYPGLVSFGNFQQSHDITQKIIIERRCDDPNYVQDMRKIIEVYFKERYKELLKTGEILNCLIYCATGNPRFLIKTIELSLKNGQRLKTETTKDILKDYYRNELWQEHRKLAEKYSGHKHLINWGDEFISDKVISELTAKNTTPDKSSIYFGVAINSPSTVIHSLKILEYSGSQVPPAKLGV